MSHFLLIGNILQFWQVVNSPQFNGKVYSYAMGLKRFEIPVWVIRDDHIPPDFILGFDIIRHLCKSFGNVTLEKNAIRMGPSRIPFLQKFGKLNSSFLLTSHPILPIIPAAINGYPVSALFDCGASVTYCWKSVAEAAGIRFSGAPKISAKTAINPSSNFWLRELLTLP